MGNSYEEQWASWFSSVKKPGNIIIPPYSEKRWPGREESLDDFVTRRILGILADLFILSDKDSMESEAIIHEGFGQILFPEFVVIQHLAPFLAQSKLRYQRTLFHRTIVATRWSHNLYQHPTRYQKVTVLSLNETSVQQGLLELAEMFVHPWNLYQLCFHAAHYIPRANLIRRRDVPRTFSKVKQFLARYQGEKRNRELDRLKIIASLPRFSQQEIPELDHVLPILTNEDIISLRDGRYDTLPGDIPDHIQTFYESLPIGSPSSDGDQRRVWTSTISSLAYFIDRLYGDSAIVFHDRQRWQLACRLFVDANDGEYRAERLTSYSARFRSGEKNPPPELVKLFERRG